MTRRNHASIVRLTLFVALATASLVPQAFAKSARDHGPATVRKDFRSDATAPRGQAFIDANSPSAAGGGSQGYNEMLLRD
jgi:hypothetical protein